ncbi:hypothetical protein MMC11_001764 [Xylographa trunciseda]|nr:hypothetical protein [Xylographa trunciseda]
MAADALASSGTKRSADHFDNARGNYHNFGGDNWPVRFMTHRVPVSSRVIFLNGDETVGENDDTARQQMCDRLWGIAMTRFVNSTFSWESEDYEMDFRRPLAIGSTALVAVAAGQSPIRWTVVKETLPLLWDALGGDTVPREVLIHRRLSELSRDNENIVKLYNYRRFPDQAKHRLYMEYASHGDLETLIRRYARWRRYFPEPFLWFVFHQLAKALLILQHGHLESFDEVTSPESDLPSLGVQQVPTLPSLPNPPQIQTISAQQATADLQQSGAWDITEIRRRCKQLGVTGEGTRNRKDNYLNKLRDEYRRIITQANTTSGGPSTTVGGAWTIGGASTMGGGPSATGGGPATGGGVPTNPRTVQDELLWARNAIIQLRQQLNTSRWREIVHRDICPSNVVLGDPDPESPWNFYPIPKLADFGDAIETGPDDKDNPDNYQYETKDGIDWAPPEATAVSGIRFSAQSNVYQLGLTMAYATFLNPDSVQDARLGNLTTRSPYRQILVKTIQSCLHVDPEERITPLGLYRLTRTCLADCTRYLTEQAPDRFRIYEPTEARTEEMATGFYRPRPQSVALVDTQFPLADVDPNPGTTYLRPPTIDRFYPYEDDNSDFFTNPDNGYFQREQPADEVLPRDVISIADRGEHYYNKLTDPNFDALTFDARDSENGRRPRESETDDEEGVVEV